MILKICNRYFQTENIDHITITDKKVLITLSDDFVMLNYRKEEDIADARLYLKLQNITYQDIYEAVQVLAGICDVFINSKSQCSTCPLHKKFGCMLQTIPINWKGD